MTTRVLGDYGLGLQIEDHGENLRFRHSGTNHGFTADMVGYLHLGKGAVIMTNSDTGHFLIREILHSIAELCEWPDFPAPVQETFVSLPAEQLEAYAGTYQLPDGVTIEVFVDDGRLYFDPGHGRPQPLFASEEDLFFAPYLGIQRIYFSSGTDSGGTGSDSTDSDGTDSDGTDSSGTDSGGTDSGGTDSKDGKAADAGQPLETGQREESKQSPEDDAGDYQPSQKVEFGPEGQSLIFHRISD